jgi:flagellar basal-body rod modification protein FlgD
MATAAAFFNHAVTAGQALGGSAASPMAGSTNGPSAAPQAGTADSDSTSSGSATISANDFLTLLVTEMQNQDPTANTDPNEYINQLVQVNSLEQLIDINQTLSGAVAPTASGSSSSAQVTAHPNAAAAPSPSEAAASAVPAGTTALHQPSGGARSNGATRHLAPGNLGVPATNAAAQRVGRSLNGREHLKPANGKAIAMR